MLIEREVLKSCIADAAGPFQALSDAQQKLLRETAARSYSSDCSLPPSASVVMLSAIRPYAPEGSRSATALDLVLKLADSKDPKVPGCEAFPNLFFLWATKDLMDGWVYRVETDGRTQAFQIMSSVYDPGDKRNDRPQCVYVHLAFNSCGRRVQESFQLYYRDLRGKTISQIMGARGFMKESAALRADYDASEANYLSLRGNVGQEYDIEWRGGTERGVNNLRAKFLENDRSRSSIETGPIDPPAWLDEYRPDGTSLPLDHRIPLFMLGMHETKWVHVAKFAPHIYDRKIADNLVLPDSHRDLIEALLEETAADLAGADVIKGKNSGTIILCKGPPGVGKTLTAEVFAEFIKRPLYRVHAGQLGVSSVQIETNLKTISENALAWNAVVLIDECDTYVRTRGDSVDQNAIVASFLRVLEYYPGALFLTSNREDIDDAIMSRCLAIIRYDKPDREQRVRLWRLFGAKHEADFSDAEINQLADMYEIGGRDIKMVMTVATRYAQSRGKRVDPDLVRYSAQFRGL